MKVSNQIKPLEEMVFIGEINLQAKIAKRAGERLKATNDQFDELEVWCSIQSILIAAGNVSKILWPPRETSEGRGEQLRKVLKINNTNPLRDRRIRNHYEHYDERIEDWFKKNKSAVYMASDIDPFESTWKFKFANRHRVYNPSTKKLTFRGESIDLAAVLKALEEIREKCRPFALP